MAHKFASLGHPVQLAARNVVSLDADKTDIELRCGVPVTLHEFDVLTTETHATFIDTLPELPEIAVSAVGIMGEQAVSERNLRVAIHVMRSNFEGPASIIAELANRFVERGSGTLVGISSVAGERGRARNYVYGSAKAGFTAFLSGQRNRLAKEGVHIVTVLPGFVATRMTEGRQLPEWLTAQPQDVATAIELAVRKRRDIVYVRPIWRLLRAVIRHIPERYFKRMKI